MASMQEAGFYCIPSESVPLHHRQAYCGLCMGGSVLGIVGGIMRIQRWKTFLPNYERRRKPSPNPWIVFFLAVADILASSATLLRALMMIATPSPIMWSDDHVQPFVNHHDNSTSGGLLAVGTIIEVFNQYSYGCSLAWTCLYAVDIYLQMHYLDRSLLVYNVCAWTVPGLTAFGSFIFTVVGYRKCKGCPHDIYLIIRHLFFYFNIFGSLLVNTVFSVLISILVWKKSRQTAVVDTFSRSIINTLFQKFVITILIFYFCWFPNIIDAFVQLVNITRGTSPQEMVKFFPLMALEALLNPLQGLLNCIVHGKHFLFRRFSQAELERSQAVRGAQFTESTPILYRSSQITGFE